MQRGKAFRRFQEKKKKQRVKNYYGLKTEDPAELGIRAHHGGSLCSCNMCRSPRRSVLYKGKEKLTMQERRLLEDKLEEYED